MITGKFIRRGFGTALVGAVLFILASCTTNSLMNNGGGRTTESAYGNYLAARFASGVNDVQAAAKYYAAALDKEADNSLLRQQAFLSALISGNIPASAGFARPALGTDSEERLMRLSIAAFNLGKKNFDGAELVLGQGKYGPFNGEVRQLLRGWTAFGTGDTDKALALVESASEAPAFSRIAQLNTALILDLAGRVKDADTAFILATDAAHFSDRAASAYGAFLENQNRTPEARVLYEKARAVFTEAPLARAALTRLDAGQADEATPKPAKNLVRNASEGAAEVLFETAQILAAQAHFDKALVYLEMARFINPRHGAAVNLLARLMEVQSRPDDALAMFASVSQKSPYRLNADLNRARALFRIERRDEAVEIFQKLSVKYPDDDSLVGAYADALRATRQYEAALPIYERLLARQGEKADWQIYYARGTVLERLGRWREGVVDFRKALELSPNQSEVLNYLGYTYVDAGENMDEGFALIERALSLQPDAGHIVDSLGWAHYRLGHYEQAVRYLERAVELEAGEPTISDHLADAYWQAGRRLEARFQWSHTLSLEPDDDVDIGLVTEKLAHGLRDAPDVANANP